VKGSGSTKKGKNGYKSCIKTTVAKIPEAIEEHIMLLLKRLPAKQTQQRLLNYIFYMRMQAARSDGWAHLR
jgi:hypothetical protein